MVAVSDQYKCANQVRCRSEPIRSVLDLCNFETQTLIGCISYTLGFINSHITLPFTTLNFLLFMIPIVFAAIYLFVATCQYTPCASHVLPFRLTNLFSAFLRIIV